MSSFQQVKPTVERTQSARDTTIPSHVIKGFRPHPFGLVFTSRWKFDPARKIWSPRMLFQNLIPGLNGIKEDGTGPNRHLISGSITDRAAKSRTHRFFDHGDRRLKEFQNFRHTFMVRNEKGVVRRHWCLIAETYSVDARGMFRRKVDTDWIDRLHAFVLKEDLILPMIYEDLLDEVRKAERRIEKMRRKLLSTTTHRETAEIAIKETENLIKNMRAAYKKQFPKGELESANSVVHASVEEQALSPSDDGVEVYDPNDEQF